MNIFGIKIPNHSQKDILNKCLDTLIKGKNGEPLFVATLNPEILLTAKRDEKYKEIINSFHLKIIDGVGIKFISWLKKIKIGDRMTGAYLAEFLIKEAEKLNLEIGIIFNKNGFSSEREIKKYFKSRDNIKFLGLGRENLKNDFKILSKAHLILVATGHPHQEKLIHRHVSRFPRVRLAIGIGGTLDFWTKKKKRAPKIIQKIGLEWLWRLAVQPDRFKRILRATIIFPILAIFNKKH